MYTNGVRQGLGGGGKRQYDMYVARARSVSPHGRLSSVQMMLQSPHSTVRYLAPGVSPFASPGYIQHPGSRAGLNTPPHSRPAPPAMCPLQRHSRPLSEAISLDTTPPHSRACRTCPAAGGCNASPMASPRGLPPSFAGDFGTVCLISVCSPHWRVCAA